MYFILESFSPFDKEFQNVIIIFCCYAPTIQYDGMQFTIIREVIVFTAEVINENLIVAVSIQQLSNFI